jgi:hypothetical protein
MATKAKAVKPSGDSVLRARLWTDEDNGISIRERAIRDATHAFEQFANEIATVRHRSQSRSKIKLKHA